MYYSPVTISGKSAVYWISSGQEQFKCRYIYNSIIYHVPLYNSSWVYLPKIKYRLFFSSINICFIQIRNGVPTRARIQNSEAIRNFIQELATDMSPTRIFTFLRRAGHRVDGYIAQEIGPHPGTFFSFWITILSLKKQKKYNNRKNVYLQAKKSFFYLRLCNKCINIMFVNTVNL